MDNKEKLVNIAAQFVAAEITNGTRSEYMYEWSDAKLDKLAKAALKLGMKVIAGADEMIMKVK